jgi:hypothetical protein
MIIQSYNDILREIEGLELRIEDIKTSIKYYQRLLHKDAPKEMSGIKYSDMPTGNGNAMSLDRIYYSIGKLESHLYLTEEALRCKTQSRIDIENLLGKMEGIEYQVFYYRRVRGLTQEQTAEAIARCPRQVKRIEKNIKMSPKCPVSIESEGLY